MCSNKCVTLCEQVCAICGYDHVISLAEPSTTPLWLLCDSGESEEEACQAGPVTFPWLAGLLACGQRADPAFLPSSPGPS